MIINWTALPDSLVDDMTGLRKVFIRNCNLTKLPPRMEQLTEMVDFEISFNRLEEFMVDVGKWEKLNKLHLMYNNITNITKRRCGHIQTCACCSIKIMQLKMPDANGMNMPSLTFLHLGENNITIKNHLIKNHFPNLVDLYLNGNNLIEFPR